MTLAVAGAARDPQLEVQVNDVKVGEYRFENDGTIYRSAVRSGRYRCRQLRFPAELLRPGENTVNLRLVKVGSKGGIMYDTIKLEIE